jgi:O-antigen biosynthesis protein
MKVFFSNTLMGGCHYVRALIPMREGGWDGDKTALRTNKISAERTAQAVLDADVVVFHRPNDDRALAVAKMLREQGKKIVMDNDDTYKGFDTSKLGRLADKFGQVEKAIDIFGKEADLITCSTEFLRKEYLKLNPNVVVLPNCVDPDDWPDEDEIQKNENGKVRIGFVGSVGLHADIQEFIPVLDALKDRNDVELVLFALPADTKESHDVHNYYKPELEFWFSYGVEWQPFVPIQDYIETLNNLKLDILIIPRSDDYFNRCKSNIKFLEASMLKIPVVAQGFTDGLSPYQDPEDSEHMKVVVDHEKWLDEIVPLIESKELRDDQGTKARNYVIDRYSISKNIHKWEKCYEDLFTDKIKIS